MSPAVAFPLVAEECGPTGRWLEWGAVGRPIHGESVSGDAWGVFGPEECCTFVLVDGSGHGALAHQAAVRAVEAVRCAIAEDSSEALHRIMRSCHVALGGTRGAAVALLRMQPASAKATFCGVGNVELHVHPKRHNSGVSLPGMVGYRVRSIQSFETDISPGDTWVMNTDGVSSRLVLERHVNGPAASVAQGVFNEFGRREDDASVVAVKVASVGPQKPPTVHPLGAAR